jgi:hypothetical protein
LKDCTPGHCSDWVHAITGRERIQLFRFGGGATLEPKCPRRVCLLPIPGNGGDVMGPRFSLSGLPRQFSTDLRTLASRRWRGGPTLSERAVALDRLAGSLFLASVLVMSLWAADRVGLLTLPAVAESAQAATGDADPALVEKPLTSAEVRLLQRKLKALGFDPGAIDGVPGRRTLTALNAYLAGAKLDTVSKINRAAVASLIAGS